MKILTNTDMNERINKTGNCAIAGGWSLNKRTVIPLITSAGKLDRHTNVNEINEEAYGAKMRALFNAEKKDNHIAEDDRWTNIKKPSCPKILGRNISILMSIPIWMREMASEEQNLVLLCQIYLGACEKKMVANGACCSGWVNKRVSESSEQVIFSDAARRDR